jgi:hypothetical protein
MNTSTLAPVNQNEIETEFYEALQRPENYGVQAEFARQRGDRDDSYVSRMHSPHVSEVPSWLYVAADQLDKLCRAGLEKTGSPRLSKLALTMLTDVVRRHEPQAGAMASTNALASAYHNFMAVLAAREDGMATPGQVEEARERLAEATGRCGRPERVGSVHVS